MVSDADLSMLDPVYPAVGPALIGQREVLHEDLPVCHAQPLFDRAVRHERIILPGQQHGVVERLLRVECCPKSFQGRPHVAEVAPSAGVSFEEPDVGPVGERLHHALVDRSVVFASTWM
jgi:hypothetical protein